jgi:hypothetical protein
VRLIHAQIRYYEIKLWAYIGLCIVLYGLLVTTRRRERERERTEESGIDKDLIASCRKKRTVKCVFVKDHFWDSKDTG